jgi:UDP-N-acetylglucosamine acyltransferase
MLDIHQTAVVDRRARLDDDVVIGPYAIIGPDVTIGAGTHIGPHVVIEGRTTLGRENRVHAGAVLGGPPQDLKYRGEATYLKIGDRNTIRECVTLSLACIEGETTIIGDGCLLMAYVHVGHNCRIGNNVILANSVNLAGHVEVHDFASIGGLTPVHQFVRIGSYCFVGGGSRVPKDVVPYIKVAGNPLELAGVNTIGLERRGFDEERRATIKRAYRTLFRSGLNVTQATERLRAEAGPDDEDLQTLIRFIETSERGIQT